MDELQLGLIALQQPNAPPLFFFPSKKPLSLTSFLPDDHPTHVNSSLPPIKFAKVKTTNFSTPYIREEREKSKTSVILKFAYILREFYKAAI